MSADHFLVAEHTKKAPHASCLVAMINVQPLVLRSWLPFANPTGPMALLHHGVKHVYRDAVLLAIVCISHFVIAHFTLVNLPPCGVAILEPPAMDSVDCGEMAVELTVPIFNNVHIHN